MKRSDMTQVTLTPDDCARIAHNSALPGVTVEFGGGEPINANNGMPGTPWKSGLVPESWPTNSLRKEQDEEMARIKRQLHANDGRSHKRRTE